MYNTNSIATCAEGHPSSNLRNSMIPNEIPGSPLPGGPGNAPRAPGCRPEDRSSGLQLLGDAARLCGNLAAGVQGGFALDQHNQAFGIGDRVEIGRSSCRERVCKYV